MKKMIFVFLAVISIFLLDSCKDNYEFKDYKNEVEYNIFREECRTLIGENIIKDFGSYDYIYESIQTTTNKIDVNVVKNITINNKYDSDNNILEFYNHIVNTYKIDTDIYETYDDIANSLIYVHNEQTFIYDMN